MAGTIASLLGRRPPDSPEVAAAIEQLDALAAAQPELRAAAALQTALLRALYAAAAPLGQFALADDEAQARLSDGVPLLRGTTLPIAARDLRAVLLRLVTAVRGQEGPRRSEATALEQALKRGTCDPLTLAHALLAGDSDLAIQLETHALPPALTLTLLRLALLPFLEQLAARFAPLREAADWQRGYCPTCGAWPLLGEQRGLEQLRVLRCGLCASAWPLDRLCCPFCAERDHNQLGYLEVAGEEQRQRVFTCANCRSYLKLRSTLSPLTTPQLLVEELALLHLDLVAQQNDYT